MLRYNTSYDCIEAYVGGAWANVSIVSDGLTSQQITGYDGTTSEPMLFLPDTTRQKTLSVAESVFNYQLNSLNNNDWFLPDASLNSAAGYVMPYDGTVVRLSMYVGNTNNNTKSINIYVNSSLHSGQLVTMRTGSSFVNSAVNVDFSAGNLLRLNAVNGGTGSGGNLQYVTLMMTVKWRYS